MCRASGTGREVPACTEPGGEAARRAVRSCIGAEKRYYSAYLDRFPTSV
ncbi:hypothetical protein [Megasphaera lornae]|uniref:Uncharacterized protein n=1 Tax=Megasphaera lornae TaxID=1000568 RepID=D3LTH3_9FIRM|nr:MULTISPECIES: hypothetical protein [Megasphaera]EFD94512.1 hypothetical protein HMPREF0889_0573 [Megasphaera genomosp. type_1 str. 28L]KXB91635.1 hypothetical protein HMPREF3033_00998 [Veillonellaceae bacterium DNF00751]